MLLRKSPLVVWPKEVLRILSRPYHRYGAILPNVRPLTPHVVDHNLREHFKHFGTCYSIVIVGTPC